MAKLKGPLLSLGASQQLAKTLVFFPWKGLDVVREYVIPTNPKSTAQTTQRGYLTEAVAFIHTCQSLPDGYLDEIDQVAFALLGSTYPTPRTWFNQIVKDIVDQQVAGLKGFVGCDGNLTPGDTEVTFHLHGYHQGEELVTAGDFWYGTSKTALNKKQEATCDPDHQYAIITGLTNGVKYYFQFRPTAHADFVGTRSGIYHCTPSA